MLGIKEWQRKKHSKAFVKLRKILRVIQSYLACLFGNAGINQVAKIVGAIMREECALNRD